MQTQYTNRTSLGLSVAHQQIQYHLKNQIPALSLEKKIKTRRADAVWEEQSIVFEIQLSPIGLEEAAERCRDYIKAGYRIVWILHDGVFNGSKVSPAEQYLRHHHPTYYTNGDRFYDQLDIIKGSRRLYKGESLEIAVDLPSAPFIEIPSRTWTVCFKGDLHTFCARYGVEEVRSILKPYLPVSGWRGWLKFLGFKILEWVSTPPK